MQARTSLENAYHNETTTSTKQHYPSIKPSSHPALLSSVPITADAKNSLSWFVHKQS
jgi:hypothetical protein